MTAVLLLRLVPADRRGVPVRDGRTAVIGATDDLGDGERVWFRVAEGPGRDPWSPDPVVVEVRPAARVRAQIETVGGRYAARGWIPAHDPVILDIVPPPVLSTQQALQEWARTCAQEAR